MRIVWDEPKRLANLRKHGIEFADFEAGFDFNAAVIVPTRPSFSGRPRLALIGALNGVVVTAIVSPLGSEAISLVSIRPASEKERAAYGI